MTSTAPGDLAVLATAAARRAEAVAETAGVRVTRLSRSVDFSGAAAVLQEIWQSPQGQPMAPETLVALDFSGNYVSAAFIGDEMVGVSAAFRTETQTLHSHISGVLPQARGRSVGLALKLHQRAWALARGVVEIGWTFDPLIRRNAHFNLVTLGARASTYLPDFYGEMVDAFNPGDTSDRLFVEWDLTRSLPGHYVDSTGALPALTVGADGEPVRGEGAARLLTVSVPPDLAEINRAAPGASGRWRLALREALSGALGSGYEIAGLADDQSYVLRRKD